MRFSISLRATPSPAAVLKCEEPVKRNFNWTKDFKHCTVDVNMSRVSRPENPRSNRKTRNSAGRLWISTSSSWSEKFRHPVSESCTIFLPTSAFTALARSSVHLPWRTNPYQLHKAKCEARASSTRWKFGSPAGYDCKSSKSQVPRRERAMLFRIRTLSMFCVAWASLSCLTFKLMIMARSPSGKRENLEWPIYIYMYIYIRINMQMEQWTMNLVHSIDRPNA